MKLTKCINFTGLKLKCISGSQSDDNSSGSSLPTPTDEKMSNTLGSNLNPSISVDKKLKNIQLETTNSTKNDVKSSTPFKAPRNKIALKPGRSLMDWIRLGTSGKDLTGVGGRFLDITHEELKKHDKPDDAWLSIKGRVYNVTAYNEFHPGGFDEIAKGFGKDATQLFMQAHSWVNYENMLKKCVVGRLAPVLVSPIVPKKFSNNEEKNIFLQSSCVPTKTNLIAYDWYQSNEDVVIVLYTKYLEIKEENIIVDVSKNKILLITIYLKDFVSYVHSDLEQIIQGETQVNIGNNGKVEIVFHKEKLIKWQKLGDSLSLNGTWKLLSDQELHYRSCQLIARSRVSKNTYLLTFDLNEASQMRIPTAKHISLKLNKNDAELERSYTPIPKHLKNLEETSIKKGKNLHLMIKIYRDGLLTPHINDLEIGNYVQISDYYGAFDINTIDNCDELVLFAAGTGVTPMISIVHRLLINEEEKKIHVRLMFCNKTRDDILWREQLQLLSDRDKRFTVIFVLSEPEQDWTGLKGRVSMDFVKDFVAGTKGNVFSCICGPTAFNQCCNKYLQELGYETNQVHVFANN
uniref:Cytochrome b5 reductase 4 n=1 Tax=Strigamia maritima TaxID=126957 RepID=T1J6X7_STRMM